MISDRYIYNIEIKVLDFTKWKEEKISSTLLTLEWIKI
jgi:hypothetical protein